MTGRLATRFDTPDESPGFLLWQLSNKWQSRQRRALATFGLTHVQFVLLAVVTYAASEKALTQKEIANLAKTDTMMTSQVVRVLEKKGLLVRSPSPDDKRAIVVASTQAGVALVNKAIQAVEAVDRQFFAVLGDDVLLFSQHMRQLAKQ